MNAYAIAFLLACLIAGLWGAPRGRRARLVVWLALGFVTLSVIGLLWRSLGVV
jgi:hypothetical protein